MRSRQTSTPNDGPDWKHGFGAGSTPQKPRAVGSRPGRTNESNEGFLIGPDWNEWKGSGQPYMETRGWESMEITEVSGRGGEW
jgi:hypothetical protein